VVESVKQRMKLYLQECILSSEIGALAMLLTVLDRASSAPSLLRYLLQLEKCVYKRKRIKITEANPEPMQCY